MKVGQFMKEHKTAYPILIHLLEGTIELGVQGEKSLMKCGDIIAFEGDIPHDLVAIESSIIRLTLSKSDTFEQLKRLTED